MTCPQRRRGRGRRKSARNKRGNNSVDRSVTDHRDEITDRIRPSFRRSTRSRTEGRASRVSSGSRASRSARARSGRRVVRLSRSYRTSARATAMDDSSSPSFPTMPTSSALPREPARRDPRRRGAKARDGSRPRSRWLGSRAARLWSAWRARERCSRRRSAGHSGRGR